MPFSTEIDLVEAALSSLELRELVEPLVWPMLLTEPRGLFGIPDVVFTEVDLKGGEWVCNNTAALEMKLRDWRRALTQAFRYRSFAHVVFVVLDAAHAAPAIRSLDRFRRSNVGLISIDDVSGTAQIHFVPRVSAPRCGRMRSRFTRLVERHIQQG
jgi:hypothetical protein